MRAKDIKRLQVEVSDLYKELESFRRVAEVFDISLSDVIWLVKGNEQSILEHFKEKSYDDFPMFNFG